jgi:hypothetical protein
MQSIELGGKIYPMKFGLGSFKILALMWNCKGLQSVSKKIEGIFPQGSEDEELGFDQMDDIGDLIMAGIQNASPGNEFGLVRDEVVEEVIFDAEKLQMVINAFIQSVPQKGNPQPQEMILGKKKIQKKK